jgi:hypothetical protein
VHCRGLAEVHDQVLRGNMTFDPLGRADRHLKIAEKFFGLARSASTPFLRVYYERVAQRYLSSEGESEMPDKPNAQHGDRSKTERSGT